MVSLTSAVMLVSIFERNLWPERLMYIPSGLNWREIVAARESVVHVPLKFLRVPKIWTHRPRMNKTHSEENLLILGYHVAQE